MGSVLHVHAQWVTPSPVPGGSYSSKSEGRITIEYKKVVHKAGPRKE